MTKKEFYKILSNLNKFIFFKKINENEFDILYSLFNSDNVINDLDSNILVEYVRFIDDILKTHKNGVQTDLKIIETNKQWKRIYNFLKKFFNGKIISSVGSQGFLSIPLYRNQMNCGQMEILRLHIWDESLKRYINQDGLDTFSVHSHKYNVQSWVLTGDLFNYRYINDWSRNEETSVNYFKINWEKTKNNNSDNSMKSTIVNTGVKSYLKLNSKEIYKKGETYSLNAGEFHKSKVNTNNIINSSLFLFSSIKGIVDSSYLVGNNTILKKATSNHEKFNCWNLVDKLNENIKND